jgi:hypothetical protein
MSYILRDVSFTEVGSVCRVALREPMHLCTCVSEEGVDGETACSETPSLLSYTLIFNELSTNFLFSSFLKLVGEEHFMSRRSRGMVSSERMGGTISKDSTLSLYPRSIG